MTVNSHHELAQRLRAAYSSGQVPPLRDSLDPDDATGAYAVQAINTQHWLKAGRRLVGRKIGLTSRAVQMQLGVDRPDFGTLFGDMQIADGGQLDPSCLLQPKAEAEIALRIGRTLDDPTATADTVLQATIGLMPAIEIVDSRITDWKITFADTVADNGSSARFVLGPEVAPSGQDLWSCGMVLERNGQIASVGAGAACLDHPLNAAAWLARTLAELGSPLQAGDIVLTGALGPMVELRPGDHIRATIAGLGSCSFSVASVAS
jgi:2-keto-4-pentenoate hydratase